MEERFGISYNQTYPRVPRVLRGSFCSTQNWNLFISLIPLLSG